MSIQRYKPVGVNHSSVYLDPAADGAVVMHEDHAAAAEALQARAAQLTEAGLADQARADAWRDRFQAQKRIAKELLARVAELEAMLPNLGCPSCGSLDAECDHCADHWTVGASRDDAALAAVDADKGNVDG